MKLLNALNLLVKVGSLKYKTMSSYCLKSKYKQKYRNTENVNPKISRASNGKTIILSNCAICGSKKSKFIKNRKQMDY